MAKVKSHFICQSCGQTYPKWMGRCNACGEWGVIVEEVKSAPPPTGAAVLGESTDSIPKKLIDIEGADVPRSSTGIGEFDRVLGGGLVPGALMLVGGDPGIGKSTLLLQASDRIAQSGRKVLYVTGEESTRQTKMRFDRVGASSDKLWVMADTALSRIENQVRELEPVVLVVDSVQTLYSEQLDSAPGSVGQLRAITARLMGLAKNNEICTFLVGHVTKEGAIAGPKVLEHMVDTVLYLEGQRGQAFRILRAVKNRFGSTDELGAFEMREEGLKEVVNPSAFFLAERAAGSSGSVVAASYEGTRPLLVEIQALVSPTVFGTPRRTTVGVDSHRVALLLAVLERKAGLHIGSADVFVNVAGGLRLDEPALDLPIAIALASSHLDRPIDPQTVLFGEIGLGGEVRAVIQGPARVAEAQQLGFHRVVCPTGNLGELGSTPEGFRGVSTVAETLESLF